MEGVNKQYQDYLEAKVSYGLMAKNEAVQEMREILNYKVKHEGMSKDVAEKEISKFEYRALELGAGYDSKNLEKSSPFNDLFGKEYYAYYESEPEPKKVVINLEQNLVITVSQDTELINVQHPMHDMNTKAKALKSFPLINEQQYAARIMQFIQRYVPENVPNENVTIVIPDGTEDVAALRDEIEANGMTPAMRVTWNEKGQQQRTALTIKHINSDAKDIMKVDEEEKFIRPTKGDEIYNMSRVEMYRSDENGQILLDSVNNVKFPTELSFYTDNQKPTQKILASKAKDYAKALYYNGYKNVILGGPTVLRPFLERAFHNYGIDVIYPAIEQDKDSGKNVIVKEVLSEPNRAERYEFHKAVGILDVKDVDFVKNVQRDERKAKETLALIAKQDHAKSTKDSQQKQGQTER